MSGEFLPERWKELAPLLDAALERESPDRQAFLDHACAGDTALRVELETLLAECERSDRLFVRSAVERFAALLADPARPLPEVLAGRYRVGRELGAGGMATVYLARDLKHDRDVALKVLRADLSAVIGASRFLEEVRVTAKLDHPHILTLIDSGSADGILFYVMPYVRGETLRAKVARERQLSLEDALSITRQIAAALDYAHTQGVVHRDIKPENILLHEGVAVLADFGIALAVQEAGGSRITETGLSLGTPQYMSPEQAIGDRVIDGRSDVYSLAAVLYEMIAGEPPVTGATKQAIIAKLLTEAPTKLRVIRSTVPESVDRAVAKALSKVPVDRFATAGEFARALDANVRPMPDMAKRWSSKGRIFVALGLTAGVTMIALVAVFARGKVGAGTAIGVTLTERRQITFTGDATIPAISSDGKALAFRASNCGPAGCTYGIEVQNVPGAAPRRLVDGASAIYSMEWSPDSRSVLFVAKINPLVGTFLISALNGAPRLVSPYIATFFAGGDSLLSNRPRDDTKDVWLSVSGLDGLVRDSIRVAGPGEVVTFYAAIPGSKWIIVGIYPPFVPNSIDNNALESRVIGRDGRVVSRSVIGHSGTSPQAHASSDALWVSPGGLNWPKHTLLRIPLDSATGRVSSRVDTLHTGVHTGFGVTADGGYFVLDEGSTEFDLWGLEVSEAVRGAFRGQKRLLYPTSSISVGLSPDGKRIVSGRDIGRATGGLRSWSTVPFAGGAGETPFTPAGVTSQVIWSDDSTVALKDRLPGGARLVLSDVATGVVRSALVAPDRFPNTYAHVPSGGWVWVNGFRPVVSVQLPADTAPRRIQLPAWYGAADYVAVSRDGRFVAFSGTKAPAGDSLGVSVLSLADGTVTPWLTTFGEDADVSWLKDGTLLLLLGDTPETYSIYHLLSPGRAVKLGTIPRRVSSLSVSKDLKHIAVVVRSYHGDASLSRVLRP